MSPEPTAATPAPLHANFAAQPLTPPTAPPDTGAWRLAAFSVVIVGATALQVPIAAYLPAFYAQHGGLGLAAVGLVFMLTRLWGAAADPLIGHLSDRSNSRYGRRAWIVPGALLTIVSTWAVFMPPPQVSALWLGGWLFALCLGAAMVSTPLYAWGGELSTHYHQRSRIQAYLQTAASLGVFLVLVLPALLDRYGQAQPVKIAAMGGFVILTLLLGLPPLLLLFREPPASASADSAARGGLKRLATDPLVLRVIGSDFFVALGQGFRGSTFILFVSSVMQLPAWASLLLLLQYAFGVLASPLWLRISYRLGKSQTLITGELAQVAINLLLLLVAPGQLWPMLALTTAQGLCQGSGNLMLRAMIADLAGHHRASGAGVRSGLLFSVFNVTSNAAMALAVGIGFTILGWFGFSPHGPNNAQALTALHAFFAVAPALGHALSALLIWRLPKQNP